MTNKGKNKFYRLLHLDKETLEVIRIYKKIKKQLLDDCSKTGVGK